MASVEVVSKGVLGDLSFLNFFNFSPFSLLASSQVGSPKGGGLVGYFPPSCMYMLQVSQGDGVYNLILGWRLQFGFPLSLGRHCSLGNDIMLYGGNKETVLPIILLLRCIVAFYSEKLFHF